MEKKSKADIKKMIADLHAKPKAGDGSKSHHAENGSAGKASKGSHTSKTYRPKI